MSWDRRLIGRAGFYIRIEVNPQNPDEVLIANSSFHRSTDGGLTFPPGGGRCGDCHDIWIDPKNGDHWVVTDDAGLNFTRDHAKTFTNVTLPVGQMYHLALDEQVPYWIYSNRQDDGTMRGPVNSPVPVHERAVVRARAAGGRGGGAGGGGGGGRGGAGVPWQQGIGGCESGFTIPVPGRPDIIWATCYGNEVTRFDNRIGRARSVSPWIHTLDSEPEQDEVPLPLVAAARLRSVRAGDGVLRLPGDLQDRRPGPDAGRSSAPTCRRRIPAASCRRAASSATTSASSTARWCSRSRRRRSSGA